MTFRSTLSLAALISLGACSSSSPSLLPCAQDEDCGGGNLCVSGSCAVNLRPVASFSAPEGVSTHRLVPMAASVSDPEGRPTTSRWSVSVKEGADGCAPDVEPSDGGPLGVIFWCPGAYEVTVVPVDDQGLEGAPVVRSLTVAAAVGAPTVTAGPPIDATHRCDLAGPSCLVEGPGNDPSLELRATASDPEGASLAFEWTAVLPDLAASDATLHATFLTSTAIDQTLISVSPLFALGLARLTGQPVSRRSILGALATLAGVALFFC